MLIIGNTLNGFYSREKSILWDFIRETVNNNNFKLTFSVPQLNAQFVLDPDGIDLIDTFNENRYGTSIFILFFYHIKNKNHIRYFNFVTLK